MTILGLIWTILSNKSNFLVLSGSHLIILYTPGPCIMRFSLLRFFKTFQKDLVNAIYLHYCDLSVKITSLGPYFFHYCESSSGIFTQFIGAIHIEFSTQNDCKLHEEFKSGIKHVRNDAKISVVRKLALVKSVLVKVVLA